MKAIRADTDLSGNEKERRMEGVVNYRVLEDKYKRLKQENADLRERDLG